MHAAQVSPAVAKKYSSSTKEWYCHLNARSKFKGDPDNACSEPHEDYDAFGEIVAVGADTPKSNPASSDDDGGDVLTEISEVRANVMLRAVGSGSVREETSQARTTAQKALSIGRAMTVAATATLTSGSSCSETGSQSHRAKVPWSVDDQCRLYITKTSSRSKAKVQALFPNRTFCAIRKKFQLLSDRRKKRDSIANNLAKGPTAAEDITCLEQLIKMKQVVDCVAFEFGEPLLLEFVPCFVCLLLF